MLLCHGDHLCVVSVQTSLYLYFFVTACFRAPIDRGGLKARSKTKFSVLAVLWEESELVLTIDRESLEEEWNVVLTHFVWVDNLYFVIKFQNACFGSLQASGS